jgi:serine/threonine protein kinase
METFEASVFFVHSTNWTFLVTYPLIQCNILVSDTLEPLISDFGLSRHLVDMSASTQAHGSPRWNAPELFTPKDYDLTLQQAHALPIDVWSFGMTVLVGFK